MALTGPRVLCNSFTRTPLRSIIPCTPSSTSSWSQQVKISRNSFKVLAAKKFVSGKNKRSSSSLSTTKEQVKQQEVNNDDDDILKVVNIDIGSGATMNSFDDGFVMPQLPGLETDFWEGPQWDGFGFFVQYMWAFGVVFSLIACGIAVATYNEGATDFKDTPVYKESIQSRELLEAPDASNSDVFESNPTEEAPSLE